jgi:hypothetical protein
LKAIKALKIAPTQWPCWHKLFSFVFQALFSRYFFMVVLTRLAIASQAQDSFFFFFFLAMSHLDWSITQKKEKKRKKPRSCPK